MRNKSSNAMIVVIAIVLTVNLFMCLILASVRVKEYGSDTEFLHADIMALLGGLFITATMLILSLLLIAEYKIRREAEIRDSSADKKESPKSIE